MAIDSAAGRIYWAAPAAARSRGAPLAGGGTVDTLYAGATQGVSVPLGVAIDPAAGRIYWANQGDNTIRGAPLAGDGTVDTLYDTDDGVSNPLFLAALRAPSAAVAAAENPKCKKLRKKLKRQKKGLANATTKAKRSMIQGTSPTPRGASRSAAAPQKRTRARSFARS